MSLGIASKPILVVLRWQLYATAVGMVLFAAWKGYHGALSAMLGGLISMTAGWAYGRIVSRGMAAGSGANAIRTLLRAEASKVILIVLQLWLVLTTYSNVVLPGLFATFTATVVIFGLAVFVRE